jgi:hypothetical protein
MMNTSNTRLFGRRFISVVVGVVLSAMVIRLYAAEGSLADTGSKRASCASASTLKVGPGRLLTTPGAAAVVAQDGDIVEIDAGLYVGDVAVWDQTNLTLRGVGGLAHLDAGGVDAQGKAIWVIKGDNTLIENIEFSGATVPDENGAGIRQEGRNLTVRKCYFHDNEEGILTDDDPSSEILIEYTEFARNGFGDGYSHNMYISNVGRFTLRYCYSHHAKIGHNVKSRARENYLLYNRIMDENDGTSSYAIDLPDGGLSFLIGNLIQQGPLTDNSTIISYGAESLSNPQNELYVVNNTMVNDNGNGAFLYVRRGTSRVKLINNIFAGGGTVLSGSSGEDITNLVSNSPGLMNSKGFDYHLAPGAAAVDNGIDPGEANGFSLKPVSQYVHVAGGEARPIRGIIDIGACEFASPTSTGSAPLFIPEQMVLEQNVPNPFNPTTTISFTIPRRTHVTLELYDLAGRQVGRLVDSVLCAGSHSVVLDVRSAQITPLASGVLLYRLACMEQCLCRKLIILR